MRAVKGHKDYTSNESKQKFYQEGGFDILGDCGNLVAYGSGKTVAYDEYVKTAKEIERLQEVAAERYEELEALKEEIAGLKAAKQEQKAPGKKAGE